MSFRLVNYAHCKQVDVLNAMRLHLNRKIRLSLGFAKCLLPRIVLRFQAQSATQMYLLIATFGSEVWYHAPEMTFSRLWYSTLVVGLCAALPTATLRSRGG